MSSYLLYVKGFYFENWKISTGDEFFFAVCTYFASPLLSIAAKY